MMKVTSIVTLAGGIAMMSGAEAHAAKKAPNVVIIVADDCNYYNIGCYGAQNNQTPNIDAIAAKGMRFDNAYNSASMSTPTRHSLYTGVYPIKNGGYANHSAIHQGIKSMPQYMSELGYRVGLVGKWHIAPATSFPFENVPGWPENCVIRDPSYNMDGATEFATRDKKQPFCMVLASVNPHAPWTGGDASKYDPAKLILPANFADTPTTRQDYANYLAEVDLLDKQVGEAVTMLKEKKLYNNTIIFFISEQGSQFAGAKWTNWTPGVKSAMMVSWRGKVKQGVVSNAIVQYEDILPTIMDIAGAQEAPHMDGRSMLSLITGETDKHRDYAFHVHNNVPEGPSYPIRAVGDGKYRLIWNLTPDSTYLEKHIHTSKWYISWCEANDSHSKYIVDRWQHRPEFELYDVTIDPFEFKNLASEPEYADVKTKLHKVLKEWMISQGDMGASMDKPRKPAVKK